MQAMLAAAGVGDRFSDLQAFGIASASDLASLQNQDLASNFGLSPSQVEAFRRAVAAGSSVEPVASSSTPLAAAAAESTSEVAAEVVVAVVAGKSADPEAERLVAGAQVTTTTVAVAAAPAAAGALLAADLNTGATPAAEPEPQLAVATPGEAPRPDSAESLPAYVPVAGAAAAPLSVPSMSSTNRPLGTENEPTATATAAAAIALDSPSPTLRPGAEFEAQAQALVAAFAKEAAIEEACLASAHRATLEGEAACSRWEAALLVAERDARAVEARQARLAEAEDYDGAEALSGQVETLAADAEVM